MKYPITEYDKELLLQNSIQYKIKLIVTNSKYQILDVIYGLSDIGTINIDSDSDVRRTTSFTIKLDDYITDIESRIYHWIGLYYELHMGIFDIREDDYIYYPCGRYRITEGSTNYDKSNNLISFSLSDRMTELNGTRNGQIGGTPIISIEQKIDGVKQTIRGIAVSILSSSTSVDKYIVDEIGEYNGMPQNNSDYLRYREMNDNWNILPYDLEYSAGTSISNILFDLRDLYPCYQTYFDVYDNFCFDMLPTLTKDVHDLDNAYLQQILLADSSESVSYDATQIKNVTEVFGKSFEIDRFCEESNYSDGTYTLKLDSYDGYLKNEIIAFKPTSTNLSNVTSLYINELDRIPIYKDCSEDFIDSETLEENRMCVVKINKLEEKYIAYYLGQYQPHALCVLTDNENDTYYTKEYFAEKYSVDKNNIYFRYEPFSPFSVQKFGEIADIKAGSDFDKITSDSNAVSNAKYYNRLSSTMFDTVTISTKLIPWLDVNTKISYKKANEDITYFYIVKNIQLNFSSGTSTITMYRFMQLYE